MLPRGEIFELLNRYSRTGSVDKFYISVANEGINPLDAKVLINTLVVNWNNRRSDPL